MSEKIKFTTTFIPLNVKNLNGHIYLDNDNLRESIDELNKRTIKYGCVYGEYNYPYENVFDTNLSKVSHVIDNVRIEDDKVVGDVTILHTKHGKELINNYQNMVFRPRSAGIVEENGLVVIKKLFTFDAVDKDADAFLDLNKIEENKNE